MSAENAHTVWRIELLHAPTKEQAEHEEEEEKEDGRTREGDNQTGGHKGLLSGTTDMLGIAAWQEHSLPYEKELHIPKQWSTLQSQQ